MKKTLEPGVITINCRGRLLELSPAIVMGILNVTPDSFFDGGKFIQDSEIMAQVNGMLESGAQIIDIGGVSTRPGAAEISSDEEWERIENPLKMIRKAYPEAFLSIDTTSAQTAKKAIEEGADIINDVSGGDADPEMFTLISASKTPYILMHMQGTPLTMQLQPTYQNVVAEVLLSLIEKAERLKSMGATDIILDPGFGFGKTIEHNFQLLASLNLFTSTGFPVLAGLSRKSMINKSLGVSAKDALNGTTVLNTVALEKGANILRVHDVKEAVEAVKLLEQLKMSQRR
jgi:dihydropteroate synthase